MSCCWAPVYSKGATKENCITGAHNKRLGGQLVDQRNHRNETSLEGGTVGKSFRNTVSDYSLMALSDEPFPGALSTKVVRTQLLQFP